MVLLVLDSERVGWRAVGFLQGRLDPTKIDRTNFYDRTPAAAPEPEPEACEPPEVKTPAGMRSGSLAAAQAKLELSMARTAFFEAEARRCDLSKVPGLLEARQPSKVKPTRSGTRLDESEGGDVSLRGLGVKADQKRKAGEAEENRLKAVREDRAEKRAKLAADAAALDADFERCLAQRDASGACQCGPGCAMAKMVRCPSCKAIKKGRCRAGKCQDQQLLLTDESARPLLLTMQA
jgi:hypothetical protein